MIRNKKYNIFEVDAKLTFQNQENNSIDLCFNKCSTPIGFFDSVEILNINEKNVLKLVGWAADMEYKIQPKFILAVRNKKIVSIIKNFSQRSDVRDHLKSNCDNFGFEIKVPIDSKNIPTIYFISSNDKYYSVSIPTQSNQAFNTL